MLFSEPRVRIWLYTQPTDMRKSYNGLSALVKSKLQDNPLSGELFVFVNRRQNQMKILYLFLLRILAIKIDILKKMILIKENYFKEITLQIKQN